MSGSSLVSIEMRDHICYIVQFVDSNNQWLLLRGRQLGEDSINIDEATLSHVVHPALNGLDFMLLECVAKYSVKHLRK